MLLSKRSEMFLPGKWPSYFKKAKGMHVWDLDGNRYKDFSIMGIGTNTLGYGDKAVDKAAARCVRLGNMSTFNCPEEVYLAERLVEMHPWSDMVRFARTGGEANAIAIRIARAASGRSKVAFCGYHGWHDWYLAANIESEKQLENHLLPGLSPNGVPSELRGSVIPFEYNDIDALREIVKDKDVGVIKMEVVRNFGPESGFLEEVRKLATDNNIVLIFDECTSGFRQSFGGIHKVYDVEPDIAVFGKALGNGYAITAVLGKRQIMECAQSTFISSTFWTERIGPSAALACLKKMEKIRSWELITQQGLKIRQGWERIAKEASLDIKIGGIPAISNFAIEAENPLHCKTLITQEMLKRGYLAGTLVFVSTQHTDREIDRYLDNLRQVFIKIRNGMDSGNLKSLLEDDVCHSGFKRLN